MKMNLPEDAYSPQPKTSKTAHSGFVTQDETEVDIDFSQFTDHQVFIWHLKDKFPLKNTQIYTAVEKYLFHYDNKNQDIIKHLRSNLENVKRRARSMSANRAEKGEK